MDSLSNSSVQSGNQIQIFQNSHQVRSSHQSAFQAAKSVFERQRNKTMKLQEESLMIEREISRLEKQKNELNQHIRNTAKTTVALSIELQSLQSKSEQLPQITSQCLNHTQKLLTNVTSLEAIVSKTEIDVQNEIKMNHKHVKSFIVEMEKKIETIASLEVDFDLHANQMEADLAIKENEFKNLEQKYQHKMKELEIIQMNLRESGLEYEKLKFHEESKLRERDMKKSDLAKLMNLDLQQIQRLILNKSLSIQNLQSAADQVRERRDIAKGKLTKIETCYNQEKQILAHSIEQKAKTSASLIQETENLEVQKRIHEQMISKHQQLFTIMNDWEEKVVIAKTELERLKVALENEESEIMKFIVDKADLEEGIGNEERLFSEHLDKIDTIKKCKDLREEIETNRGLVMEEAKNLSLDEVQRKNELRIKQFENELDSEIQMIKNESNERCNNQYKNLCSLRDSLILKKAEIEKEIEFKRAKEKEEQMRIAKEKEEEQARMIKEKEEKARQDNEKQEAKKLFELHEEAELTAQSVQGKEMRLMDVQNIYSKNEEIKTYEPAKMSKIDTHNSPDSDQSSFTKIWSDFVTPANKKSSHNQKGKKKSMKKLTDSGNHKGFAKTSKKKELYNFHPDSNRGSKEVVRRSILSTKDMEGKELFVTSSATSITTSKAQPSSLPVPAMLKEFGEHKQKREENEKQEPRQMKEKVIQKNSLKESLKSSSKEIMTSKRRSYSKNEERSTGTARSKSSFSLFDDDDLFG